MRQHVVASARSNLKTAVFYSGISNREPDGDEARVISFLERHAHVLMPVRRGHMGSNFRRRQGARWRLDADMLDGVGGDFRADRALDSIENG